MHDKNEGLAQKNLQNTFVKIENQLPPNIQDDWWRFGTIVYKMGYVRWFLANLEQYDYDVVLAPYYVALKAMIAPNADAYFNSKAVEIREHAQKLMHLMLNYIQAV